MNELLMAIVSGITVFAATNIDDLFVLMVLYSQRDDKFHNRAYHHRSIRRNFCVGYSKLDRCIYCDVNSTKMAWTSQSGAFIHGH
ncbi:hypothetical protein YDYSG_42470 [Paenibacillus tyrfis]|nr:hypothetical protein YDYSG_42470 [Paenibacillus tyrfis]